ncbi:MAG: hypothetical protein QM775_34285 [Pirellulales bacterium]
MLQFVSIEFVGGPHDGLVLTGDGEDAERSTVEILLQQSDGGKPGALLRTASPYAVAMLQTHGLDAIERMDDAGRRFPDHDYEIFVRRRGHRGLFVRARHVGVA